MNQRHLKFDSYSNLNSQNNRFAFNNKKSFQEDRNIQISNQKEIFNSPDWLQKETEILRENLKRQAAMNEQEEQIRKQKLFNEQIENKNVRNVTANDYISNLLGKIDNIGESLPKEIKISQNHYFSSSPQKNPD